MSDQNTDKAAQKPQEHPIFRLQKMYIKDLSFENPNAPDVFTAKQGEPKVEVNLGLKNKELPGDDLYEVSIKITANITQGTEGKTLFITEIEHCGVFLIKNIPAEHMNAVMAVDAPTMLFPYTRQIISQISVDGGFIPFLMEPVNFLGLYQNQQKQAQEQAKKEKA
nr:protein-export chaperone SecB [Desulfobulbaceae bacterium]